MRGSMSVGGRGRISVDPSSLAELPGRGHAGSVFELLIAVVLVLVAYWLIPQVIIPALARRQARRRGGPPKPAGPWAAAVTALLVALWVVLAADLWR